jgi:hypothetical protein
MATDRQLAANRANAQKSTGPRTPEGKRASSANATKSGIYAKATLIRGEDPAEFETFRAEHYDQFAPANPDERDLLDLMLKYKWQLRRLHDCYDQMWLAEVENDLNSNYHRPDSPLVRPFKAANRHSESLIKLSRMIQATDRAFHRTRTALIRAQEKRQRAAAKITPAAAELAPTQPLVPAAPIGFVSSPPHSASTPTPTCVFSPKIAVPSPPSPLIFPTPTRTSTSLQE